MTFLFVSTFDAHIAASACFFTPSFEVFLLFIYSAPYAGAMFHVLLEVKMGAEAPGYLLIRPQAQQVLVRAFDQE